MPKAKAHPDQLAFCYETPKPAVLPGSLAGLEAQASATAGVILNTDPRSRAVIAAEMSELLGDDTVTPAMLDAYASPARPDHKIPLSRFFALVAVCGRQDLLDPLLRRIGAAILVGEEIHTARLGQIDRQIEALKAERQRVARVAPVIRGGRIDG